MTPKAWGGNAIAMAGRHVLAQGNYLKALGHGVLGVMRQRLGAEPTGEVAGTATTPSHELVEAYLRHLEVDPARYRDRLPPHLFPQWSYAFVARALSGAPHPLHKILHAGCRIACRRPLVRGPLTVAARFEGATPRGCCDLLRTRVATSAGGVECLSAEMILSVPSDESRGEPAVSEHVPQGVERVASWHLDGGSSREFATLGGDLNPLHWLPGYARLFGFEGILAHGFALLARAFEGLVDHRCDGDVERLALLDVRFPNALPLPASVGLFADEQRVFVGTAVGAPACLAGRYEGTAD